MAELFHSIEMRKQEFENFEFKVMMKMDFQEELAVMKDELKNIKMGSGSTVCSEDSTDSGWGLGSGTFARPRSFSSRNEVFIPRKTELTGWVNDYTKKWPPRNCR